MVEVLGRKRVCKPERVAKVASAFPSQNGVGFRRMTRSCQCTASFGISGLYRRWPRTYHCKVQRVLSSRVLQHFADLRKYFGSISDIWKEVPVPKGLRVLVGSAASTERVEVV